jgi:Peptidase family S41
VIDVRRLFDKAAGCGILLLACAAHGHGQAAPTLSPQQLRDDLSALEAAIERSHPDIEHSVDARTLAHAINDVRARLDRPMTRDEAWAAFAALNPVLADGHLSITFPGGAVAELERHLKDGGLLFPYNVHVDERGKLFIRSKLNGDVTPLAGARVEALDGVPAREVTGRLLAHINGDTPAFRAALLSDRFPFWYWKFFGDRRAHRLKVAGSEVSVDASGEMPLAYREKAFEQLFRFDDIANTSAALLTIGSFVWRDKAAVYEFTRSAFTRIRDAGVRTLVIDIRSNSGGDDDMWIDGIMPYIASAPYRNGSSYQLKIVEGRQKEGQQVGEVVRGSQQTMYPPRLDHPQRFKGRVYVLIGPRTYSSAVLFANVVQDSGFGTIAGMGGAARTTQSGGTQNVTLPNTQIGVVAPRFVLKRPSGAAGLLEPDLLVVDDPFRPMTAVETLLRVAASANSSR